MKAKTIQDVLNEAASEKDLMRIRDMFKKSKGDDDKVLQYARNMAKSIDNVEKAQSRADAAIEILGTTGGNPIADIFMDRVKELGGSVSQNHALPASKLPGGSVSQKYALPASKLPNPKTGDGSRVDLYSKYAGSPVLPLGRVNLETGNCQYFNVYDTWENKGTIEVWENDRFKYKLVFTSGDEPYEGIGKRQLFKHDQTWAKMGVWKMIDYTPLKDARGLIPYYGKSISGYVYK